MTNNNPAVIALEGVQELLAQENTMWRTLNDIDNYCEREIAKAEGKEKLEIPKQEVKECAN